jgi:hypothetical protein
MNKDSLFRVIRTFIIAFLGIWLPLLLGWLQDLADWANSDGQQPFPDMSALYYGGVSAAVAAFVAILNLIWNLTEDSIGKGMLRPVPDKTARRA